MIKKKKKRRYSGRGGGGGVYPLLVGSCYRSNLVRSNAPRQRFISYMYQGPSNPRICKEVDPAEFNLHVLITLMSVQNQIYRSRKLPLWDYTV